MKKFLFVLFIFCLFCSSDVIAQNTKVIEPKLQYAVMGDEVLVKQMVDEAINNIFDEVELDKDTHILLKNFNDSHVVKNELGFSTIQYQYFRPSGLKMNQPTFEFIVDVLKYDPNVKLKVKRGESFYDFPILGIRVHFYQSKTFRSKFIDMGRVVRKHLVPLWLKQQEYLDIRLSAKPSKDVYQVGETISIKVSLQNLKKSNIKVKKLDIDTVQFYLNDNAVVSFPETDKGEEIILRGGSNIRNLFQLNGFKEPGEYIINMKYVKTNYGVNPYVRTKVVVED